MNGRRMWIGSAAAAGLLLVASVGVASVAAQQTPTTPEPGFACGPRHGMGAGMMGPRFGWQGGPAGLGTGPGFGLNTVAQALGITTDELIAARQAGKTTAQLAEEKGLPLDTIVQAQIEAHKQVLDARVAAGTLTQEQADAWLAQMESHLTTMLTTGYGPAMMWGSGTGPGYGPGGRFGPPRP